MKCEFCQTELLEDAGFCGNCGKPVNAPVTEEVTAESTPVVESAPAPAETSTSAKDVLKKASKINLHLVVGTILIVIGFIRLFSSGVSISSTSFGADFYTYSYQGIVACAEMLGKINATVSWLIIGLGAAIDLKGIKKK